MVWSAITEVDQMTKWLFEPIEEFRADVGFATQFNIHHEGTNYINLWKTLEVVPQSRIVYNWRYEGLLGVIAANFVELYNRPSFLLTKSNYYTKCSSRSIYGFDIGKIFHEQPNILHYGKKGEGIKWKTGRDAVGTGKIRYIVPITTWNGAFQKPIAVRFGKN